MDAIFNLLKTDSRFTVVSAPRLRVKNNASASFSVGSDVPVLGSVTVNNNVTTQSVEYRSSGVLFNVTPSLKSRTMDLKIEQQLSNFVTTETGVNNSPTLIKRDVTTEVSLADGDIILLGGLAEQKDSTARSGWSFSVPAPVRTARQILWSCFRSERLTGAGRRPTAPRGAEACSGATAPIHRGGNLTYYQIVRYHIDGTEEIVFDSHASGTDLPKLTGEWRVLDGIEQV